MVLYSELYLYPKTIMFHLDNFLLVMGSASFFKIKLVNFGYFDPEKIFPDNENK